MGVGAAAARGAGVTLLGQAVRVVLQIGSVAVLARLLSPRDFGIVAMVTVFLVVAEVIRDSGLSAAAMQAKELSPGQRTNLFWINVGLGVLAAATVAALAPALANFYDEPRVREVAWAICTISLLSGANTQLRVDLARRLRFTALAVSDVLAQTVGVTVAITSAWLGYGLWALVAQMVSTALTTLLINAWNCRWWPGLPDRAAPVGELLRFGWAVLGLSLLRTAVANVDNLAIGRVLGAAPLGIYSRAFQLTQVPLEQVTTPMNRVVVPTMSRAADDPEGFLRFVRRSQLLSSYLLGPVYCVAAGLAVPFTAVFFGPGWGGVAPVFVLLAVGGVFKALMQVPYWLFIASGHPGQALRVNLLSRPLAIAIMLSGLPWGVKGVAAGNAIAFAIDWLIQLRYSSRAARLPMGVLVRDALQTLLLLNVPAGLLGWLATVFLADAGHWWQLVGGLLAAANWALIAVLWIPPIRRDFTLLLGMLGHLRSR